VQDRERGGKRGEETGRRVLLEKRRGTRASLYLGEGRGGRCDDAAGGELVTGPLDRMA
jgi:hypothetical protein